MTSDTSLASNKIRAVVHPTDLTALSDIAFAHAVRIALAGRAKLYILHSISPAADDVDWVGFPSVRKLLADWDLLKTGSSQAAVAEQFGIHVAKIEVHNRDAVQGIVGFLDTHDSEFLVLATHRREGVSRWLHGSIAESIARHAHLKALFVPEGGRGFVDSDRGEVHLRRVLIPIDHEPRPEGAIDAARQLAHLLGYDADIRLLYVGREADMPVVRNLPDGVEQSVKEGDVVDQIRTSADDWEADLIAMSTSGRQGFLDALRGSTSERVLRQAPCPVLAIPMP